MKIQVQRYVLRAQKRGPLTPDVWAVLPSADGPLVSYAEVEGLVEPLVEAVKETLCDDHPCARCDHLRKVLATFEESGEGS